MHSRIYQVDSKKIDKEDFITEADFLDHWFIGGVADYVSQDTDRKDDLEWLQGWLQGTKGIEVDVEKGTLKVISKKEYFKDKFSTFKECLEKLKKTSLDDFISSSKEYDMYKLNEAYDAKFGFYIWAEGYGLVTFDHFVRNIAEEGEIFHIGATLDYHY